MHLPHTDEPSHTIAALEGLIHRYQTILESAGEGICGLDPEGRVTFVNPAALRMLGYAKEEMMGRREHDLFHHSRPNGERLPLRECAIVKAAREGVARRCEEELFWRKDGSPLPVAYSSSPVVEGGRTVGAVLVFREIERPNQGDEERRLLAIIEETPDFVALTDPGGRILYCNQAARKMIGLSEAVPVYVEGIHPPWAVRQLIDEGFPTAARRGVWRGETAILSKGRLVPALQVIVAHKNEEGEVEYFSTIARDITDRKRMEEQLAYHASHDSLTGLPNRRYFQEELCREIVRANREGSSGALLVIDLDSFKEVNDSFGHRVGDTVLVEMASLLRAQVGEKGVLARLGGDEFAVVLARTGCDEALELAARILDAANSHVVELGGVRIGVTLSVGIALFPQHGANEEELMVHADAALYSAKESGRNDVALYSRDENAKDRLASRFAWDVTLREAIEGGRFALECQPITDLRANVVAHYELLLRLEGDEGFIMPASFLESAERSGLIRTIDRYVVRQGIQIAARLQRQGRQVGIAVNLSGKSLGDFGLLDLVAEEIEKHRVDPSRLTFEITERMAVAGPKRAREIISRLRKLGIHFALDDFGIGFSSFESLKILPVQYVKIDGSFIKDIVESTVDQRLVQSMVEVAHGTGKRVIAEYVGDERTLELLRAMGVDYAQGYYIGKPRPVAALA